jgi:hypothetical protein
VLGCLSSIDTRGLLDCGDGPSGNSEEVAIEGGTGSASENATSGSTGTVFGRIDCSKSGCSGEISAGFDELVTLGASDLDAIGCCRWDRSEGIWAGLEIFGSLVGELAGLILPPFGAVDSGGSATEAVGCVAW